MTPAETMQVEAIRTSALGVFQAARGLMQALDVLLVQQPDTEADDDATFDDSPSPESKHGTQQARKRR